MALPPFLTGIMNWLRAGYPEGVPENDYLPLLALLARRLTDDEVRQIAATLVEESNLPVDQIDIGVVITKVTNELPKEIDVDRVRARLQASGWPTVDPLRRDDTD